MEKENLNTTNPNEMTVVERVKAPTPKFFKTLRTIGIALAAAGGAILAAPVAVPAALVSIAGYVALAGGVMTAVSQTLLEVRNPQKGTNIYSNLLFSPKIRKYWWKKTIELCK